jgi:hypothetical protein
VPGASAKYLYWDSAARFQVGDLARSRLRRVRLESGRRALDEVSIHLTLDDARAIVFELNNLLDHMAIADFSPNIGGVELDGRELDLVLSTSEADLEAYFAQLLET